MFAVSSSPPSTLLWSYFDYIDPRYLPSIISLVLDKLWRGPPPQNQLAAFELDEVDEFGQFHKAIDAFELPTNKEAVDAVRKVYKVHLPSNVLSSLEDGMLRRVVGASSKSSLTTSEIRSLCVRDPQFFTECIFTAHRKYAPLYELIHETYLHDYLEEPDEIIYEPEKIEVIERDGVLWMNCSYKGEIHTQLRTSIPFVANCSYNLLDPKISTRSIFIDPRRGALKEITDGP
jgi:hypothetical protein